MTAATFPALDRRRTPGGGLLRVVRAWLLLLTACAALLLAGGAAGACERRPLHDALGLPHAQGPPERAALRAGGRVFCVRPRTLATGTWAYGPLADGHSWRQASGRPAALATTFSKKACVAGWRARPTATPRLYLPTCPPSTLLKY